MSTVVAPRDQERYLAEFERRQRRGAPRTPAWLATRRRAAIARFAELGFPTTRDEDWRYTNLAPLAATAFRLDGNVTRDELPAGTLEPFALGGQDWPRLVFVNGRFSPRYSATPPWPGGVRVSSLAEAMAHDGVLVERHLAQHAAWETNVFAALNMAFVEDGAFLHIPADVSLPMPIELLFLATAPGALVQPRVLIVAGAGSRFKVVERYLGFTGEAYFTNAVTEIEAAPSASVDHYVLQEQGAGAFHIATIAADLEHDSSVSTCGTTFGGRLARTTLAVRFGGQNAQAALSGLYVVDGRQHVDNHVTVDHAVPRCSSRQLYKGVLDGSSRAVFNGRIIVRPDAQKTDANQTNKHLLLSDGVEVDSKPQLEIFADDVRCTHGAAEGQLAPEALFYLRSRGLDEASARALLTYGFAREVVDGIAVAPIRAYLDRLLTARLTGRAVRETA
jgi:Fe-S cluster assembly protein SufD